MKNVIQKTDRIALSRVLKVIAEPKRLEILALLMQGVQCNCELGGKLEMAPNLISHHLRVLHEAGLIEMERDSQDSRWIYYSIQPTAVNEMLLQMQAFFDITQIQARGPNCGPRKPGYCKTQPIDIPFDTEVQP